MKYLKQLVPLTYRSFYTADGQKHFSVWKMFMGKVYDHTDVLIK